MSGKRLQMLLRDGLIYFAWATRRLLGAHSRKRIIALHDIEDESLFRRKMAWLAARFTVVPLGDLLNTPAHPTRTQVALTFDDGYECAYSVAAPILQELGLPAVFFVCSGFVGSAGQEASAFVRNRLNRTRKLKPLTVSHLQELAGMDGFEIGGHTVNHVNLGRVTELETLAQEIRLDRQRIEAWIQRPVRWFAYPFGGPRDYSPRSMDVVAESGYEAAFTIVPGEVGTTGRFQVPRDSLDLGAPERLWQAWLDGSYDALYQLKPDARLARSPARR